MAGRSGKTVININIGTDEILDHIGKGLVVARETVPNTDYVIQANPGNGLAFDGDFLAVDAGAGLKFDGESKLAVNTGAGLVIDDSNRLALDVSTVNVDPNTLAGNGLAVEGSTLVVDTESIKGPGLSIINGNLGLVVGNGLCIHSDDTVSVDTGAGLTFTNDGHLIVDTPAVAGTGLAVADGKLAVDTAAVAGAGLVVVDGKLHVDAVSTPTPAQVTVLSDVDLSIDKFSLTVTKTRSVFNVEHTEAGLVTGFVLADNIVETETLTIPDGYGYAAILSVPHRDGNVQTPNFYKKD